MPHEDRPVDKTNRVRFFNLFAKKPEPPHEEVTVSNTEIQRHAGVTWIDVRDPERSSLMELGRKYGLQPIHTSKSLAVSHIARMEVENNYIFLLLHFPYLNKKTDKIVTSQVMIFLGKNYLITVHGSEANTVHKLFDSYRYKSSTEIKSPARILFHLIARMLEDVKRLIHGISIELDDLEDTVFDEEMSDAEPISRLRHKIMRLRRIMAAQKTVLQELEDIIDKFSDEQLQRYYNVNTNRSIKLWETVEEARETIEIYKDADFTSSQERTNDILAILTIIFTLSIPATVMGALYGMNILLPGGIETGPWMFFGQYTTLICIIIASATPALAMYIYFKKKKWF